MVSRNSAMASAVAGSFLMLGMFWIASLFSESLLAQTDDGLPQILSHSETAFAVFQGDRIHLEILVRGEPESVRWTKSGETICKSLVCDFESSGWGFGTHEVSANLLNAHGSRTLTWRIKVLDPPPAYNIGTVAPAIVGGDVDSRGLAKGDMSVVAIAGKGFLEGGRGAEVIGNVPHRLDGHEKLKTSVGGVLRWGRPGSDEHMLPPRSVVQLQNGRSGLGSEDAPNHRILKLESGTLRSRNFSNSDPVWTVTIGSWLEVHTDSRGDVVVAIVESAAGPLVKVAVLRGKAILLRSMIGKTKEKETIQNTVEPGMEIIVREGEKEAKVQRQEPARWGFIVEQTTPQWVPGQYIPPVAGEDRSVSPVAFLRGEPPQRSGEALRVAAEMLKQGDFPAVVEAFAATALFAREDKNAALLLGTALFHVNLHREAARFLKIAWEKARKTDDERVAGEAAWWLGRMAVANRKWAKAVEWLDAADDFNYPDKEGVAYYRGLAELQLENKIAARKWFHYSLWYEKDPEIAASVRSSLNEMEESRFLKFNLGVGAFYDSNLTKAPKDGGGAFGLEFGVPQGRGLLTHLAARIFGFRNGRSEISVGMASDARIPLGALQVNFARVSQVFDVAVNLALGEVPWLELGFRPWLGNVFVGSGRAADMVGTDLRLGLPTYWNAFVATKTQKSADPQPTKQDVLDPILWQIAGPVDRSHSVSEMVLGLRPLALKSHTVDLELTSETIRWTEDKEGQTKSSGYKFFTSYSWIPFMRTQLSFDASIQKRDFNDTRKDTLSVIDGMWRWYFTPMIYQDLQVAYESQSSNEDRRVFKRTTSEISLNLEL